MWLDIVVEDHTFSECEEWGLIKENYIKTTAGQPELCWVSVVCHIPIQSGLKSGSIGNFIFCFSF